MTKRDLYSLSLAARVLEANRNLVTFLVADREIPTFQVGTSKCLDETGFLALKNAVTEYRDKREVSVIEAQSSV